MKQVVLAMVFVILAGAMAQAQETSVPPLVNYQGMLTDASGKPLTGTRDIQFNLYDKATGGTKIWGPQIFSNVPLVNGMFNVILGTTDTAGNSIAEAFGGKERYLGIKVGEEDELAPRQQILSTPFAIKAEYATQANNGGDVFTRWGNGTCPEESELLYSGFGFNEHSTHIGGGAEPVCVAPGDPASEGHTGNIYGDLIDPLGTGQSEAMPPGITEMREIKCAKCYVESPVFEIWGTSKCPKGWTAAYTGYGMGAYYNESKTNRKCVDNLNFDDSVTNSTFGSVWYGTGLNNANIDLGDLYQTGRYVKCAVCVKE